MTKPWADGPFKLISPPKEAENKGVSKGVVQVAVEMALAHNGMIRALNAIYLQAPYVSKPSDIADFITFCQMYVEELHLHHSIEETYFFPSLEEALGVPGVMQANVEQHHAFEKGVEEFKSYVYKVKPEDFDAGKIRSMIEGFSPVLVQHLGDEIPSLLALDQYGEEKVVKVWRDLEGKILSLIKDKSRVLPFGFGGNDRTFENGRYSDWPSFPWFVPYMTKYIFMWKYKSVWRFSPCDVFGQPRELMFVKDE